MAKKILSLVLALAMVSSFACISAFAAETPKVYDNVTKTLTLSGAFEADGDYGAIWAKNGAKLTIDGTDNDTVKGLLGADGYSMAVFAEGAGTVVTINGGYYTNEPDPKKEDQSDLIYAKAGANIVINGGTFKCATPQWTLNYNDAKGGVITVKGGKFYQFDPSNAQTGAGEIVVPEGYTVVQNDDWYEVVAASKVYDNVTKTLTLSGAFEADGDYGAIWAKNGAKLTIDGTDNDTVKGLLGADGYSMAVFAEGAGTVVTINGGYYTNEPDPKKEDQSDLIYAKAGANIVINGGTFKCATPQWTLNYNDAKGGVITVKGGKFYQFDPSNAQTGAGEIVVPEGYTVVQNDDWYEVVAASITHDSTQTRFDEDGNGAIRFVFNVSIPKATKTYFGAYILPLNIFNASGVANAVQVQYDTDVETSSSFSADLVKIPADRLGTSIYAIPYIKTANGVVTFAGASASVQ